MIATFILGSCAVGAILGAFLVRRTAWRSLAIVAAALVGIFVYCFAVPKTGTGFDDIGYAIVAFLMVAPGFVGLALGAGVIWWRARRDG